MENAGAVYHRSYPVTYPSGSAFIVKVFFPAGMADGMSFNAEPEQQDLIDMAASRTIEHGKFVQKRNIAWLKELGASLRT